MTGKTNDRVQNIAKIPSHQLPPSRDRDEAREMTDQPKNSEDCRRLIVHYRMFAEGQRFISYWKLRVLFCWCIWQALLRGAGKYHGQAQIPLLLIGLTVIAFVR